MSNNTLAAEKFKSLDPALAYLKRHPTRFIFPIKRAAKMPPLVKDNLDGNCSNDPERIKQWAARFPQCNWGLAHRKSRVMVIDVDLNEAKGKVGADTYALLDLVYGFEPTETTTTPSGGKHHIYEGEHVFALGENGLGRDIDCPNYSILPGCVLADGTSYVSDGAPSVPCPSWVYDVIRDTKAKARILDAGETVVELDQPANVETAIDFLQNDAVPAIEGSGGDFNTLKTAMYLKDLGISPALTLDLMLANYNPRCVPPWERDDLEKKIANAFTYSSLSRGGGKTAEADFGDDLPEPIKPKGDPGKIKRAARDRAKDQAAEAARPTDERDRKYTKQEVAEEIVYVSTLLRFFRRDDPSIVWTVEGFNNKFGYLDKGKLARAFFEKKKGTIRMPDRMVYKPTLPEFVDGSWNQWRPSTIEAIEGDTSLWDAHLEYLFPDKIERDHLLKWMAGVVQQQQVKPMHALLLIGRLQGTGKSFVIRVLAALIGERNWQALTQDILANGFTGWATRTKLVTVEELRAVAKTEITKKLHPWITQREMTVNEKNLPTFVIDQCIAFAFMSNKPDAIELDNSDRRYLVLETMAKPHTDGVRYYQKLYGKNGAGGLLQDRKALSAILYQLMNRDLKGYDIAGPAPWTAAKVAMKAASANDIGQWMQQHSGQKPFSHRVVTVGEIIGALPKFMQSRISMKSVREALEYFGGISWPTQIEPNGRKGDKLRVWLLGEAADRCRNEGWLDAVGKYRSGPKSAFDVLKLYREDHGPGVAVVTVRMISEDDAPALLEFGDAVDDFADEPSDDPDSLDELLN